MEAMNPLLQDIMKYAEQHLVPTPAEYTTVEVSIRIETNVMYAYIDELYSNLMMAVQLKGGELRLEKETFTKYINTLVRERVRYVRGERIDFGPTSRLVIPSYLSCVLSNIGRARHLDFGIELVPKQEFSDDVCLPKDETGRISNQLRLLKGIGFEYAEGYTRDREGSFEFMAFTLMDGVMKTISKEPHPVYALLSSTLGVRGIETVLSPRINYGSESHLTSLVRMLAGLKV